MHLGKRAGVRPRFISGSSDLSTYRLDNWAVATLRIEVQTVPPYSTATSLVPSADMAMAFHSREPACDCATQLLPESSETLNVAAIHSGDHGSAGRVAGDVLPVARAEGWLRPEVSGRVAFALPVEPARQIEALRLAQRQGASAFALRLRRRFRRPFPPPAIPIGPKAGRCTPTRLTGY